MPPAKNPGLINDSFCVEPAEDNGYPNEKKNKTFASLVGYVHIVICTNHQAERAGTMNLFVTPEWFLNVDKTSRQMVGCPRISSHAATGALQF